jgi:hypothetical protein
MDIAFLGRAKKFQNCRHSPGHGGMIFDGGAGSEKSFSGLS